MNKPLVLIVDDETGITNSLARSLRDQYTVFTANTSHEALEILKKENIAIILSDQRMPGMPGIELLAKAQVMRPRAVGILFSAYSDTDALIQAVNLSNVKGYFAKPWNLEEIQSALHKAVDGYETIATSADLQSKKDDLIADLEHQIANLRRLLDTISMTEEIDEQTLTEMEIIRQKEQRRRETVSMDRLSSKSTTAMTAITYGSASIKINIPNTFQKMCESYAEILDRAVETRVYKVEDDISQSTRQMAEELGFLRAGARDIIDIHNEALKNKIQKKNSGEARIFIEESRIVILQLMGNLLSFYRFHFSDSQERQLKESVKRRTQ